jgi:Transposase DDE domain
MHTRHDANAPDGTLRQALTWVIKDRIFDNLTRHGNTKLLPADLVILAVLWVWSDQPTLTAAFAQAQHWTTRLGVRLAIHSYQGLSAALATWTGQLLLVLWQRCQHCLEECGQKHWRVGRWLALAVDGSRVSTPRTRDNEQAFCAPRYGHSRTAKYRKKKRKGRRRKRAAEPVKPQIWTTLLWHMGLRLPWSWKNGPSYANERDHFRQLLAEQKFPADTLFCADAGFVGYDLWKAIQDAGHSFLIRVGGNVTLLRGLGYVREHDGLVYCWPEKAAKKRQPPLVLRLWSIQVGRCAMSLLTNVRDEADLSAEQARELYRLRWGIELQFRSLKQTFGRRKLRSKTAERALVELDWSWLGVTLIQLFAVKERLAAGELPERSSLALALRLVRALFAEWSPGQEVGWDLSVRLRGARTDAYQRQGSKKARYRPKYKDKPAAGTPKILTAQRKHHDLLEKFLALTAGENP